MDINPKVIDISHYDDVQTVGDRWVGFERVYEAGYRGVINKVTQGRGMVDKSYVRRRPHALAANLLWGAYHYIDRSDPRDQARHFIDAAQPDARTLLALDHEDRQVSLAHAKIFMEECGALAGRYPWLYSGFLIKEQLPNGVDPYWRQMKLWLAHYSTHPTWPRTWTKPTLWQYTGDGIGPGPHDVPGVKISGGCDINSFDGTDEELAAVWAT